jgi:hypothetical protein
MRCRYALPHPFALCALQAQLQALQALQADYLHVITACDLEVGLCLQLTVGDSGGHRRTQFLDGAQRAGEEQVIGELGLHKRMRRVDGVCATQQLPAQT